MLLKCELLQPRPTPNICGQGGVGICRQGFPVTRAAPGLDPGCGQMMGAVITRCAEALLTCDLMAFECAPLQGMRDRP